MDSRYEPYLMFEVNNVKYSIVKVNGFFRFFKYVENKLSEDLLDEEIKLCIDVYLGFKINKDTSVQVCTKWIQDREFEIWYDLTTKLHFWYEIKDGKRCMSSEEDNVLLNLRYNHMSEVMHDHMEADKERREQVWDTYMQIRDDIDRQIERANERKERQRRAKKVERGMLILGGISVAYLLGMSFLSNSECDLAKRYREHEQYVYRVKSHSRGVESVEELKERLANQEYDFSNIQSAVEQNENLSDKEKDLIFKLKGFIDRNNKYMDVDAIRDRLATLKIEYTTEKSVSDGGVGLYAGVYYPDENTITIYESNGFDDTDLRVLLHEIFHVFQIGEDRRITLELSDEVTTREEIRELYEQGLLGETDLFENSLGLDTVYGTGYTEGTYSQYSLFELIPEEDMRLYQFNPNERILLDALMDIEADGKKVKPLSYKEMDLYKHAVDLLDTYDEYYDYRRDYRYNSKADEKIQKKLDRYYITKYKTPVNEYLRANIMYFDNTFRWYSKGVKYNEFLAFQQTLSDVEGEDVSPEEAEKKHPYVYILPRTYFSDAHQNPIIGYRDIEEVVMHGDEIGRVMFSDVIEVELDENMQKIYQNRYNQIMDIQRGKEDTDVKVEFKTADDMEIG